MCQLGIALTCGIVSQAFECVTDGMAGQRPEAPRAAAAPVRQEQRLGAAPRAWEEAAGEQSAAANNERGCTANGHVAKETSQRILYGGGSLKL
jgi:hypothetical protein